MKRYVCTVVCGLLLALASTGTATAGLPLLGQSGTQVTSFGDQTVGEQKNDADVAQWQGNGNLSIAPAVAIFGDAETWNAQGNDNTAVAVVDQTNSVDQSQSSFQEQSLDQSDTSCCDGQSQTGEQSASFGDQSVDEQKNDAEVSQSQGNGNINIAPAIAVFGDAETTNYQGNDNTAIAVVEQSNDVDQSQSSIQKQWLDRAGGGCCDGQSQTGEQSTWFGDQFVGEQKNDADVSQSQGNGNINVAPAIAVFGDAKTTNYQGNGNTAVAVVDQSNSVDQSQWSAQKQSLEHDGNCCLTPHRWDKKAHCCEAGPGQTAEQTASFGDQSVEKQKNEADVVQKQGNHNVNVAPAFAPFGKKGDSCRSKCAGPWKQPLGGAETTNAQGNENVAVAWVDQSNSVDQSQQARQFQALAEWCKGLITR